VNIEIVEADLADPQHGEALLRLLDSYARESGGQSAPIPDEAASRVVSGLANHPSNLVLLAQADGEYAGASVCFWLYSTFAGRPFINVHDLVVDPGFRNRGIGTALLNEIENRARLADCCRLSLEVHDSNADAKRLYERFGFGPWNETTLYVTKRFD
jgi:ribosomal protein S18 acetylase RimI-like enzyme